MPSEPNAPAAAPSGAALIPHGADCRYPADHPDHRGFCCAAEKAHWEAVDDSDSPAMRAATVARLCGRVASLPSR
jgi:hypothetical protein